MAIAEAELAAADLEREIRETEQSELTDTGQCATVWPRSLGRFLYSTYRYIKNMGLLGHTVFKGLFTSISLEMIA